MWMQELDDKALLREYVEHDSEEAFATLVARHINKVYSVALRHARNPHQAEEITQAVFVTLAQKSRHLGSGVILSGWLYKTARLTAVTLIRSEIRRAHREEEACMQTLANENESDVWPQIAPLLDTAMAGLKDTDRHAVVLRFFDGKDMREVGATFGMNEDAARKRVNRAVEKLRRFFTKRGVVLPAAALTAAISANAVQAAPVGLAVTISSAAVLAGTTIATATTTATITKAIAMTMFQKTIITVTIAAAVGTGIYEAREASNLRQQNQALQQQQTPLTEQIAQLQQQRDKAANQLASLSNQIAKSKSNYTELLKLRGENGRLRTQTDESLRENRALRAAQANAGKNPLDESPAHFAKETWAFAGYATPEATLQSLVWAQTKGDTKVYMGALAPEAQAELKSALERKPDLEASMMSGINKVKGFTILQKVPIADDGMMLRIRNEMEDGTQINMVSYLKLIKGEWKLQSGHAE